MTIPGDPTTQAPPPAAAPVVDPARPDLSAAPPAAAAPVAAAAPPADAPPAAAPPADGGMVTMTQADLEALVAHAVNAGKASVPGTVPAGPDQPATPPPVHENKFVKGDRVSYTYFTPYDGEVTRQGMVLDTLPDEGAGARSVVGWFHDVSGPIGDHLLAAG